MTRARLHGDEGALAPALLAFAVLAMGGIFVLLQLGHANVLATESRTASDAAALAAAHELREGLDLDRVNQSLGGDCSGQVRGAADEYAARNGATVEECTVEWGPLLDRSRFAVNVAVEGDEGPSGQGTSNDLTEQRPEWESRAEVRASTLTVALLVETDEPALAPLNGSSDWESGEHLNTLVEFPGGEPQGGEPTTGPPSSQGFAWPLCAPVTSEFGPRWGSVHHGIDLGAPIGVPIGASADGVVSSVHWSDTSGNVVHIDHDDGFQTSYHHMSAVAVSVGDEVELGDYIGDVGNTGTNTTGPHLHLEIRSGDGANPHNPRQYLDGQPCG